MEANYELTNQNTQNMEKLELLRKEKNKLL